MIIILLGPPGSGKGTQANFIQNKLSIPHLSTGDILRQSVKNETDLGNKVKNIMAKGELVSDDLVLNVTTKIIGKISKKDNPQTMLGVFGQKIFNKDHLIDDGSIAWLAIDRVRDPGNLGTIFRTCNATGIKTVILIGNCCDPFSPECVRASMGAIFSIKILCISLDDFLIWSNQRKNKLIVTSLKANKFYTECNWGEKPILVMGNEQSGVSKEIESSAEELIKLPMMGTSDSLNLSVSTGIFLYEILKTKK